MRVSSLRLATARDQAKLFRDLIHRAVSRRKSDIERLHCVRELLDEAYAAACMLQSPAQHDGDLRTTIDELIRDVKAATGRAEHALALIAARTRADERQS